MDDILYLYDDLKIVANEFDSKIERLKKRTNQTEDGIREIVKFKMGKIFAETTGLMSFIEIIDACQCESDMEAFAEQLHKEIKFANLN